MTEHVQATENKQIPAKPMGSWVLQARRLQDCPLHRIGDRLLLRPPGLHHAGQSCCLIPFLRLRSLLREGKPVDMLRCNWEGCKGAWTIVREEIEALDSSWDPLTLEADLEKKPFLLQLPQAVAVSLINSGEKRNFPSGTLVLADGQVNQDFYLVVKGFLEVMEGDMRVATIPRGECFGELSVLTHQSVSNSVRCATDCVLVAVPRDRFYELLSLHGSLGNLLNRLLARRLRASNQQLEQILRPGIWGNLEAFPFLSVVQSIQAGTMTGVLTITRPRGRAVFGFDQGNLRHGMVGSVHGEDALLEIFRWNSGVFRFQNEPLQLSVNIHGETMAVLIDSLRRFDEEQHSSQNSASDTTAGEKTEVTGLTETRWDPNSNIESSSDTTVDHSDTSEFEIPDGLRQE